MPPAEDTTETAVVIWLAERQPRPLGRRRGVAARNGIGQALGASRSAMVAAGRVAWMSLAHFAGGAAERIRRPRPRLRRVTRGVGTALLALSLAFVPGTLLLAAVVLLWQRFVPPMPTRPAAPSHGRPPLPAIAAFTALPPGWRGTHRVANTDAEVHPHTALHTALRAARRAHRTPRPARGTADLLAPAPPTPHPAKPPSCSAGTRTTGPLEHPAELPVRGPGFAQLFPHRHLDFGTDALVAAIARAAATVHAPGDPPLMVLNLSGPTGDQAHQDPFHPGIYGRSHGAGRAADLAFFVDDTTGQPVPAVESTLTFDDDGTSEAGTRRLYLDPEETPPAGCVRGRIRGGLQEVLCPVPAAAYHVDFGRTWRLVQALLEDPAVGVVDPATGRARPEGHGHLRFVFVSRGLEARLLDAGRRAGAPEALLRLAAIVLHAPTHAKPFDHSLHLDLWCTDHDEATCGCRDGSGPWRRWREGTQVIPPRSEVVARRLPRDLHAPAGYLLPGSP